MSLHAVDTMPGVLIDESDTDDSARALFIAAREGKLDIPADRLPTQAEILFTARWLHMDPMEVAFNNDVNFNELEPGDLSEADRIHYQQPAMNRADLAWLVLAVAISTAITIAAISGGSGYIWQRWFT